MTTDDILDRLFAAFTHHQQVTPQLMTDVHAEIHRLRREVTHLTRQLDNTERAAHAAQLAQNDRDTGRQVAAAVAAQRRQHAAVTGSLVAARRLAERRAELAEEFVRTIAPLPTAIAARRKTSTTPTAVDALLLHTTKAIREATSRYQTPAHAGHPERMTA